MVSVPVRSIIPELKLGDYLALQAHKPCSVSHLLAKTLTLLVRFSFNRLVETFFTITLKYIIKIYSHRQQVQSVNNINPKMSIHKIWHI